MSYTWEHAPSADEEHPDIQAYLPKGTRLGGVLAYVSKDPCDGLPWTWIVYNDENIDEADVVAKGGVKTQAAGKAAVTSWAGGAPMMVTVTLGEPQPAFPHDERPKTIKDPSAPATEAQIDFLRKLGQSHDVGMEPEQWGNVVDVWVRAGVMTKGFASEQIEAAKALPKRFKPLTTAVEPGYYTKDDQYYVVVKTKDGARTYAKRLVKSGANHWSWEYERGAVVKFQGLTPLTLDQASMWGALHGHCIICCKPLTDPESVKQGIGPTCRKRVTK